jgi:hypothetical protein
MSLTNAVDVQVEIIVDSTIMDALKDCEIIGLISVTVIDKMYVVKSKKQVTSNM